MFRMFTAALVFAALNAYAQQDPELAAFNKHLPEDCQIHSPQMALAYYCAKLGTDDPNPQLHTTIESDKGVNRCYNTFVNVKRENNKVRISVIKDVDKKVHRTEFTVDENQLRKGTDSDYIVQLPGEKAQCYAITEQYKGLCSRGLPLLGGSSDLPMTLKISKNGNGFKHSVTASPADIAASKGKVASMRESNDQNMAEVHDLLRGDARKRLVEYAKQGLVASNLTPLHIQSYNKCNEALTQFEQNLKLRMLEFSAEETATLAKFKARFPAAKTPAGTGNEATGRR